VSLYRRCCAPSQLDYQSNIEPQLNIEGLGLDETRPRPKIGIDEPIWIVDPLCRIDECKGEAS
jgi:hypothetical protein